MTISRSFNAAAAARRARHDDASSNTNNGASIRRGGIPPEGNWNWLPTHTQTHADLQTISASRNAEKCSVRVYMAQRGDQVGVFQKRGGIDICIIFSQIYCAVQSFLDAGNSTLSFSLLVVDCSLLSDT